MPFVDYHSARIRDPKDFDTFRIEEKGNGITLLIGIRKEKTEVAGVRFSKTKFTPEQARSWLHKNNFTPLEFMEAIQEKKKDSKKETRTIKIWID